MTTDNVAPSAPTPESAQVATGQASVDLGSLQAGQTVQMPVLMMPGIPRVFADEFAINFSQSGFVDLTAISFRQNMISRPFVVRGRTEGALMMEGGDFASAPILIEEANVRITIQTALNLAGALLEAAKRSGGASEEQIQQVLARVGAA